MTTLDIDAIIDVTRSATREQGLKVREDLRRLLRDIEDICGFPHSFQTKAEQTQREIDERRLTRHE